MKIKKILVANRGEIALRIMRSCREMGIATAAVYSYVDRSSPFVLFADEAYALGGVTSQESYLRGDIILDIARKCGADAIHPGYGFLSENADFAEKVLNNGLIFIGPPVESIRLMGNKTAARKKMITENVPVVPGTEEAVKNAAEAKIIAAEIGYPILIKAAAGGGGKGMRLVKKEDEFEEALQAAIREAKAAFNDESVYLEKFVEEPHHIEFQILADGYGNIIHLGERDCSIQRRHQKVVEESPSVLLDDELRRKMGQAAVNAAKACNYVNAGTVEFLVDKDRHFYFLEMNTRLQVEHPVTELVSGMDLVREQILIAYGKKLNRKENLKKFWGHAIECRIYAEDFHNNFAPSPGKITFLRPADGPGIREDSGVAQGNEISLFYDPMISKLIAWGLDREQAVNRMLRALQEYEICGIQSNIPFLIRVMENEKFRNGEYNTGFIDEQIIQLQKENNKLLLPAVIGAALSDENKQRVNSSKGKVNNVSMWKIIKRKKMLR